MTNRHASHPASDLSDGRPPVHFPVKAAAPRTPYRLGGVLRWGADEAGGLRLVRPAGGLSLGALLSVFALMVAGGWGPERPGGGAGRARRPPRWRARPRR